jgi:hypothetical protein
LVRFLRGIAIKIAKGSKSALQELVKEMDKAAPPVEKEKAVDFMDYM